MKIAAALSIALFTSSCVPAAIATTGAGVALIALPSGPGCVHACPEAVLGTMFGSSLVAVGLVGLAIALL